MSFVEWISVVALSGPGKGRLAQRCVGNILYREDDGYGHFDFRRGFVRDLQYNRVEHAKQVQ